VEHRTPPAPESWLGYDFRVDKADLSTQESSPFLFLGSVVDANHGAWDRYAGALLRRPDTLSCLRPSEQEATRPNLLAFDWHRVRGYDRDVCLFRVATSLGSIERLRAWMAGSEMRLLPTWPCRPCLADGKNTLVIRGVWTLDQVAQRPDQPIGLLNLGIQHVLQALNRRSYPDYDLPISFRFDFDDEGRLVYVD